MKSELQIVELGSKSVPDSWLEGRLAESERGSLRRRAAALSGLVAAGFVAGCAGLLVYGGAPGMAGLEASATEFFGGLAGGVFGQLWLGLVVTAAVLAGE